tara:strand:- start:311 stop:673 length:363 start_codon:yes stop_codon:yes gene_type:complete
MIKTTSYEISKELEILGFENLENANVRLDQGKYKGFYLCYDLETILDALPTEIDLFDETGSLEFDKKSVGYHRHYSKNNTLNTDGFWMTREKSESLADTAARLLIKLIKDKIINIKSCQI